MPRSHQHEFMRCRRRAAARRRARSWPLQQEEGNKRCGLAGDADAGHDGDDVSSSCVISSVIKVLPLLHPLLPPNAHTHTLSPLSHVTCSKKKTPAMGQEL